MAKTIKNIQELWTYCQFCPICQDNCREIIVSVGPDLVLNLSEKEKTENTLYLDCLFRGLKEYFSLKLYIDCQTSSFKKDVSILSEIQIDRLSVFDEENYGNGKIESSTFFFNLQSKCNICNMARTYGNDIDLQITKDTISIIEIVEESIKLHHNGEEYHLIIDYENDILNVMPNKTSSIDLPLPKLDFSNPARVVEKIKTLILFS